MSDPLCPLCGKEMFKNDTGWWHYWTKDYHGPCPGGKPLNAGDPS